MIVLFELCEGETLTARMTTGDISAGMHLIKNGSLVEFKILDAQVLPGLDDAEFGFRIDLRLGEEEEDSNDVEWGGLGFMLLVRVTESERLFPHHVDRAPTVRPQSICQSVTAPIWLATAPTARLGGSRGWKDWQQNATPYDATSYPATV